MVKGGPWMKLGLVLLSAGVSLAVLEGVLRLCHWPAEDPVWVACHDTAFTFAPGLDYRHISAEYDVEFRTNSLGFRSPEVAPKHGLRVLLLGDSYACGYGVEQAQTFAGILRDRLHVDLVNAGIGGFEIIHQVQYYRSRGQQLQPDLVVYALYLNNDLTNNRLWEITADGGLRRRDGKPALEEQGTPKILCLLKRCVPLRRWFHAVWPRAPRNSLALPGRDYLALCDEPLGPDARQNYTEAEELLRQLHDAVTAGGAEFLVLGIPLRAVVDEPSPQAYRAGNAAEACDLLRPVRKIEAFLRQAGIEEVSLTDDLCADRQRLQTPLYFSGDGHLNAAGHRAVAEHLLPVVAAKLAALEARRCKTPATQP
jgi:5-carboxymethyl-2-hydroxymuconate isomerase